MTRREKVMVIGLDCADPVLVFDKWLDRLPNFRRLVENGAYGKLKSTVPAITVPAWMAMMSSKNPGKLGFYGFRNRANYTYDEMDYANSRKMREPVVWDLLGRAGRKVAVIGVPQTYPVKPVNGILVSSFLTPDIQSKYTHPDSLKEEIADTVGEYILDIRDFRTDDKERLLGQIYEMTEKRFKVVRRFVKEKPWDFFMMVEMGTDRIHHAFWRYHDRDHRLYEPGHEYENTIRDYYEYIDRELGTVLDLLEDDVTVMVVSDHGIQTMIGGICVNQWLINEGLLAIKEKPLEVTKLSNDNITWEKTTAWASGGYYGRLFLNVKGREPKGVIEPSKYEETRDDIISRLESMKDHEGAPLGTRVFKPEDIYPVVKGVAPDLIIYFGDLFWRSVGSIGYDSIYTFENDTGPDDANHAQHGMFIISKPGGKKNVRLEGVSLYDITPTILDTMKLPVPGDMEGAVIDLD